MKRRIFSIGVIFLCAFTFVSSQPSANETKCEVYTQSLTTFDASVFNFQNLGDHFIMYDDFKDTRVTMGFNECSNGTCNCALYIKKNTELLFVDFCETISDYSPTSELYGVFRKNGAVGINALLELPLCNVISPTDEENLDIWLKIQPIINGRFKCARLQGVNNYVTYIIRTIDSNSKNSIKVRAQIAFPTGRVMPYVSITPSKLSFKNTGGLCGMWDNNLESELFVLDKDGVFEYIDDKSDIKKAKEFWRLHSTYDKNGAPISKRCPECFLKSEKSFYCPCDDFNLFDINNYYRDQNQTYFCKVPMSLCVEKFTGFENAMPRSVEEEFEEDNQELSELKLDSLSYEQAETLCKDTISNDAILSLAIELDYFEPSQIINSCISDIMGVGNDTNFHLDVHFQVAVDQTLQNMIIGEVDYSNETILGILTGLCPKNCNNKGVCVLLTECIYASNVIISEECKSPIKCQCSRPWGGKDCSMDLTNPPPIKLDTCCDLRKQKCDSLNAFGSPFSTYDTIFAKIDLTEYLKNSEHIVSEIVPLRAKAFNLLQIKYNNLSSLALYKNINGNNQSLNFDLNESTAVAQISIAYYNDSFGAPVEVKLFDSKCRSCLNGNTSFLSNTCEINGICWKQFEYSPVNSSLYCDTESEAGINSWTITDYRCDRRTHKWSEWLNLDTPDDDGDLELNLYKNNSCLNSIYTDVQTIDGLSLAQANQVVHLDRDCYGFICLNKEQQNGENCYDYMTRECCPLA